MLKRHADKQWRGKGMGGVKTQRKQWKTEKTQVEGNLMLKGSLGSRGVNVGGSVENKGAEEKRSQGRIYVIAVTINEKKKLWGSWGEDKKKQPASGGPLLQTPMGGS